ncbi:Uncharacterised protein [uncultured archaeon]|nr:Uncharacterised protein [uncultured archaeon]
MEKKRKEAKKSESDIPKKNLIKEEVKEIFDVEKEGKEKTIISKGIEEEKIVSKNQLKKETKIFITLGAVMLGLVLMVAAVWYINYSFNHFEVKGVKFATEKVGQLTLYRTSVPGIINESGAFVIGSSKTGKEADYNFYFRKDPRKLEDSVPFQGVIKLKKENVINLSSSFNCNGDGMIAIANLLRLYEVIGGNMIKDVNASCDSQGRYGFLNIREGNESLIDKSGPACYNINVQNCEILDTTERFMLEALSEVNTKLNQGQAI